MTATLQLTESALAPAHPLAPHLVVYSLPGCIKCDMLKRKYSAAGITVVGVALDEHDDAYALFKDRLGISETPVTLVHNVFSSPAYFSGVEPARLREVVAAVQTRREMLTTIDLDGLEAALVEAVPSELSRRPAVSVRDFAGLAQRFSPDERQSAPIGTADVGMPVKVEAGLLATLGLDERTH